MAQDGNPRRVSLVFPIILITVGALFLLHNWRPAFDPWPILTTYWPLILIFVGVGKIWDSTYRSCNPNAPQGISIGATIGALAFVIVLVALLVHGRSFTRRHGLYSGTQHNAQTVDLQGAKSARARLEMGAGQLTINGGANHVLDADFTYDSSFDAPRVDYQVDSGIGQLNISQDSHPVHFGRSENDWILRFSKDIPLELKVDMGAGQGSFFSSRRRHTRFDCDWSSDVCSSDLYEIAPSLGISPEERDRIEKAGKGEGLLVTTSRRVWVNLYGHTSPGEFAMANTDILDRKSVV